MCKSGLFNDRLEVWSPGLLPADLSVDDLRKAHSSKPRNLRIADCFYRAGIIEQWGTGTQRMIKECVDVGLPEPEFEESGGFFVVRFRKASVPVSVGAEDLNERQVRALQVVREQGTISNSEYATVNGVHRTTASRDLREMVGKGILVPVSMSQGRWVRYKLA